jgi:two-component system chemotaxis sensor kinase CheA
MSDELDEVWELYAEEGHRSLDEAETLLLNLQRGGSDTAAIAALFRALHTFKGNARVMALAVIESRAHLAEDLIGLVRDEAVVLDASLLSLMLETVDVLRGMLEDSLLNRGDVTPTASTALAERLRLEFTLRKPGQPPPAAADTAPESAVTLTLPAAVELLPLPDDPVESAPDEAGDDIGAILFDDTDAEPVCLADDPVYRQIYAGMVADFLARLQSAVSTDPANLLTVTADLADAAGQLGHAASQLGFTHWEQALEAYQAIDFPDHAQLQASLDQFVAMAQHDFGDSATLPDDAVVHTGEPGADDLPYGEQALAFFTRIQPLLDALSAVASSFRDDPQHPIDSLVTLLDELLTATGEGDFPGPVPVIRDYLECLKARGFDHATFEAMEFALYETLAAIQNLALAGRTDLPLDAAAIMQLWCTERVEATLQEMHAFLDGWGGEAVHVEMPDESLNLCLRRLHHASRQYGVSAAEDLCMVLIDLFERVRAGEISMGEPLLALTRRFMHRFADLTSASDQGETLDSTGFESLMAEAGQLSFTLSDTGSPLGIETRLGLPVAFHAVMTPDSVRMAEEGLARGLLFYIIRVDLNSHELLAARFLDWMKQGTVEAVSNITVFRGQSSLFDFLVMTPLGFDALSEALLELDPEASSLYIEQAITPTASSQDAVFTPPQADRDESSSDMLEHIGELVTSQAMVMHLLQGLETDDWLAALDRAMTRTHGDWPQVRLLMRQQLDGWRERVEKLLQVETRVNSLLESLQQSALSMRTRPAGLWLKPLAPWLAALARQHERQVRLTLEGEDVSIDLDILQHLTTPLRSILAYSALQSVESSSERLAKGKSAEAVIHLQLTRVEDHLRLTVRDDGRGMHATLPGGLAETGADRPDFTQLREQLRSQGGELYMVNRKAGGLRCSLIIPLAMVVMEGMVVRVGEIRYVIPIDSIQRIIHADDEALTHLSASQGRTLLRLSNGDLLPVQHLMHARTPSAKQTSLLFVVVGSTHKRVAIVVDELIGQQQILIRPLQGYLARIRGVTGCALLASGDIGMVLNIGYIIAHEMSEV